MAEQNFICTDRCYIVHLTSSLLIGCCCCCCCCCSVSKLCLTICDPMTAACQAPLSFTISQSLLRFVSIESVMLSNCLIFCCPLLLLPSISPSIRVFANESALCIRWPRYWSFSISPSREYSGLFPFRLTGWISLQSKGLYMAEPIQYCKV